MGKQFVYKRKEQVGGTKEAPEFKEYRDSFNVDAVIRSISMADGSVLVLLDDIHERTVETQNINVKTNKVNGVTRKRDVFQSEIYLSPEDGERFYNLCSIPEPVLLDLDALKE